ncbi:histidine phosphatase family protein [Nonomuraea sp. NPDC049709]|uniref:SixA phosphatase family protein n=1 Tax=Nonomuraea sp. NPDC049709 TaxID=3154736 RepID=UPI00342F2F1A
MSVDTPRRIVLVRHAKADWGQESDHERPLAERGRKEAFVAGRWLAGGDIAPDLALVTSAVRGRETWRLIAAELSQRPRTVYEDRLYEAGTGEIITVINETSEDVSDLLVLGGNPGIPAVADALTGEAEGDLLTRMNRSGFPTSSIAILAFIGPWKAVEHGVARLVNYWAPRD